jgi:hypothetical protein
LPAIPPEVPVQRVGAPARQGGAGARGVDLLIDWVEATSHIMNLRRSFDAARSWARIFAGATGRSVGEVLVSLHSVPRETLRGARTRLDIVCMLLQRAWQASSGGQQSSYLYCDASPQWRGAELLASSMDMWDAQAGVCSHRLLPVVALDRGLFDARGKTFALLWQLWLECGGSWAPMLACCHRVCGFLSDLGVERSSSTCLAPPFETFPAWSDALCRPGTWRCRPCLRGCSPGRC